MNHINISTQLLALSLFAGPTGSFAQQVSPAAVNPQLSGAAAAAAQVPHLVKFSGAVKDKDGKPVSTTAGITFALYQDQQGGPPLWIENQNVQPDAAGRYAVWLGTTRDEGVPVELFSSGQARWLGVQVEGQPEQARVLLAAVPYALKAADAETVGGLPPSAFLLAGAAAAGAHAVDSSPRLDSGAGSQPAVAGSGTQNYIPIWTDSAGTLGNSVLFQSGTGSTAKIGVNIATPAATLDVKGTSTIRGTLSLPATGAATAAAGKASQPVNLAASVFNSSVSTAVAQTFQLKAEPVGNDTPTASGALSLLYGSGTSAPAETGLSIASNGKITFANGQTFPGAGGTITGVTAGTDLTGGGTSGNVTLNLDTTKVPQLNAANVFSASQTVNGTVTGTQLVSSIATGAAPLVVGSTTQVNNLNASFLGGFPASNFQPAGSYATLGANTFAGNQSITGNLSATGSVSGAAANFTGLVTEAGALLPSAGTATFATGYNSQPIDAVASAYSTSSGQAVSQDFRWLAEPVGNNTSSPSGKLDLLFGTNGATPAETGLSVASNGRMTFASGQTFPGAGTVTSIGSGTGLTGGPITSSGTLSIATSGVANSMLANPSLTVSAGTDLTGGGPVALGGSTTLNLDTSKVPQLSVGNIFTASQSVMGNITASGTVQGALVNATAGIDIGGYLVIQALNNGLGNFSAGLMALPIGTTGTQNTAVGDYALQANTSGGANTAIGSGALLHNSGGLSNIAIGANALMINTTGSRNTGTGTGALNSNTASDNTATGNQALYYNTTGTGNTASGSIALFNNTAGSNNTASGYQALESTTTGSDNTASGYKALYANTGGSNTATGSAALSSNTTGAANTASGASALISNTTGNYNVAIGYEALKYNTAGNNNIAIGYQALAFGEGSNNIAIGYQAGSNNFYGCDSCIYIGSAGSPYDYPGTIRIGDQGTQGTNTPTSIAGIYGFVTNGVPVLIDSGGSLGTLLSSRRYKEDIHDMADASSGLMRLRPVTFRYKKPFDDGSKPIQYGLIAEEVAEVYPDLVAHSADGQIETVKYQLLDSMLLNELQKQNATIAAQKEQIRTLEERLAKVEAALDGTTVTASSR